jgi:amino acid adenylation domain-containing protein
MEYAGGIVGRFSASVRERALMPAMKCGARTWSYAEIDQASEELAERLRSSRHYVDEVVVLDCERSASLVVGMLACVKAGAIFFVVGEHHPESYVACALSAVRNIVWLGATDCSSREKAERVAGERLGAYHSVDFENGAVQLSEDTRGDITRKTHHCAAVENAGMYLISTSGTTGTPKLVFTGVAPILHFIDWYRSAFELSSDDTFSLLSGLGYDPLIRDVFVPLCIGACVSVPTSETLRDMRKLREWIGASRVTVLHTTPQLAEIIFDAEAEPFDSLRLVAVGGAMLTVELAKRVKSLIVQGALVNVYGTSETPQVMTYHVVSEDDFASASETTRSAVVPIGKPIQDVQIEVLGESGAPCGVAEIGEIHVRTPYLSFGYYNDPVATDACFAPGDELRNRCYRTGDLGFVNAEGNLHFVGRRDRQVKYRGYRVQLEDIEHALTRLGGVSAAAVVYEDSKDSEKIICYLQGGYSEGFKASTIKRQLIDTLPPYMLPDEYLVVERMPLTSSNKIDYAALPQLVPIADARRAAPIPSMGATPIITELRSIWSRLLGVAPNEIGVDSNFFDVGGTSLLSAKLVESINSTFSKQLTLTDLFIYSNISELSERIVRWDEANETVSGASNANKRVNHLNRVIMQRSRRMREEL